MKVSEQIKDIDKASCQAQIKAIDKVVVEFQQKIVALRKKKRRLEGQLVLQEIRSKIMALGAACRDGNFDPDEVLQAIDSEIEELKKKS